MELQMSFTLMVSRTALRAPSTVKVAAYQPTLPKITNTKKKTMIHLRGERGRNDSPTFQRLMNGFEMMVQGLHKGHTGVMQRGSHQTVARSASTANHNQVPHATLPA